MSKRDSVATQAAASDVGGSGRNEDVQGPMLQPSAVNNQWVRFAALSGAVALAANSSRILPAQGTLFVNLLAYAIVLGSTIWNTFFVGLTMFKNMPRQTFGKVQSKLFPRYFALTTAATIVMLSTLLLAGAAPASRGVVLLGVSLALSLGNYVGVEPVTTKLMFDRYEIENKPTKTDEDMQQIKVLYKKFGAWHGISSLLNLVFLCTIMAYGWTMAGGMTLAL